MKLFILIPTLPEPYSQRMLERLKGILAPQIERHKGEVDIYVHDAGRFMPTGTKRNELIQNTDSDYIVFIDCDDVVSNDYVDEMLKAIEQSPDVITFKGKMTTNGKYPAWFTIKLGSDYTERNGHYYRHPNHLCAFKRSVVQHVKFPAKWVQEDYDYAVQLKQLGLLKTEVHIDKDLYTYEFVDQHRRI
jgi:glycosyltransferase involved in cell wall biosynthesis